jgi:predicted RND superfamily exporter protein
LILILAVGLGFWRLRFDVDVLDLLPSDEPTVQGLKLYEKHFTNARELVVSLRAGDAALAEKLAASLADRLRQQTNLVAEVSWQAPWMEHPEQLGELLACVWLSQPSADFSALTNRFTPDKLKAQLDRTKEKLTTSMSPMDLAILQYDPFDLLNMPALTNLSGLSQDQSPQMFASTDGTFRLIYVQSAIDLGSYRDCESWLKSIHAVVDNLRSEGPREDWAGATIRYTGRPVFVEEIATSMQHDMSHSVGGTATIIAILFWLTHRRLKPMFWLLALLGLILFATLALGGLALGTINVVSLGFAAVLLGLAVDYAVVHYQEALAHPDLTVPEIRRAIAPSILWAAITTMSAFLVLNLGGLPGLGQLGSLVAIGVAVAALVMVMIYLPPLFPDRRKASPNQTLVSWWTYFIAPIESSTTTHASAEKSNHLGSLRLTGLILLVACVVLCFRQPGLDRTGDALRPQHGEAESALNELTATMGMPPDPLWVIVSGRNEPEVYQHLVAAGTVLDGAVSNQLIGKFALPTVLWPRAEFQKANRATAAFLAQQGPLLHDAALQEGFNTNALVLTDELLHTWAIAGTSTNVLWPTNHLSQWLLKRFVAKTPDQLLVMGLVYPATNHVESSALAGLSSQLAADGAFLSSWQLLGAATLKRVQTRMWQVVTPMVILVLASLWFAFRRWTEILLGLVVLVMSGLCLLAIMALAGWSWNLMNLMALPLILGTGVDYCIFMQLALRRHGGDLVIARRSVGRALMLCGGTAMAGFGSLALSSNAGMASLGKVCAVGIGANMLISVFLLPAWWARSTRKS